VLDQEQWRENKYKKPLYVTAKAGEGEVGSEDDQ